MTKCAYCGAPMLTGQNSCGSAECIKRMRSLNENRDERTWRHKAIRQIIPDDHEALQENRKAEIEAIHRTRRKVLHDLEHEVLLRSYARMRREDGIR